MRFELNKPILLISLKLRRSVFAGFGAGDKSTYKLQDKPDFDIYFVHPGPDDVITDVKLVEAAPIEHHKVPDEWDPKGEKKYDGFIFDIEGKRGLNQYPTASYGQLSDTADRHISTCEQVYEEFNKDWGAIEEANPHVGFSTAAACLDSFSRGIELFLERGEMDIQMKIAAQLNQVLTEISKLGWVAKYEPITMKMQDGSTKTYEDIKRWTLTKEGESEQA